ncbi:MAG: M28 family peptidase [Pseudomonadota bacterium]|nr:M28 family peptidase [Pseudomonadota bacterium]
MDNRVLIAGGHLDSVEEGPGIQDNGTGTAALLTIAEEFAKMNVRPRNSIRFAFWAARSRVSKSRPIT